MYTQPLQTLYQPLLKSYNFWHIVVKIQKTDFLSQSRKCRWKISKILSLWSTRQTILLKCNIFHCLYLQPICFEYDRSLKQHFFLSIKPTVYSIKTCKLQHIPLLIPNIPYYYMNQVIKVSKSATKLKSLSKIAVFVQKSQLYCVHHS